MGAGFFSPVEAGLLMGGEGAAHLHECGLRTPPGAWAGQAHTDIPHGAGCGQSLALKFPQRSARPAMTGNT